MKVKVKRGRLDPVSLVLTITDSDAAPNLTLVTSVSLSVTDQTNGATSTWTTSITSQSTTSITVKHSYQASDTATLRTLRIQPYLTITGAANPVPTEECFDLQIVEC